MKSAVLIARGPVLVLGERVMPRHRHRDRWSSLCLWTLLTILFPAGIPAQAEPLNRPSWAEQAMFRFGEDLFLVGQASGSKRDEEGRQNAFTNDYRAQHPYHLTSM